jgi:hypothetical protein
MLKIKIILGYVVNKAAEWPCGTIYNSRVGQIFLCCIIEIERWLYQRQPDFSRKHEIRGTGSTP